MYWGGVWCGRVPCSWWIFYTILTLWGRKGGRTIASIVVGGTGRVMALLRCFIQPFFRFPSCLVSLLCVVFSLVLQVFPDLRRCPFFLFSSFLRSGYVQYGKSGKMTWLDCGLLIGNVRYFYVATYFAKTLFRYVYIYNARMHSENASR